MGNATATAPEVETGGGQVKPNAYVTKVIDLVKKRNPGESKQAL